MGRSRRVRAWTVAALVVAVFAVGLVGCRNEAQNRLRRSIQDLSSTRMHITVHALSGEVVFQGIVDGMVSRADARGGGGEPASGSYVYWYDERGRYHQTDLPYLLTSYERVPDPGDAP